MRTGWLQKCRGSSFFEYSVMLAMVALAFYVMNTYIKRGIQARVKEMSDHTISRDQVDQANEDIAYSLTTTTIPRYTINDSEQYFVGGSKRYTHSVPVQDSVTNATSIEITGSNKSGTVPAARGIVVIPRRAAD